MGWLFWYIVTLILECQTRALLFWLYLFDKSITGKLLKGNVDQNEKKKTVPVNFFMYLCLIPKIFSEVL